MMASTPHATNRRISSGSSTVQGTTPMPWAWHQATFSGVTTLDSDSTTAE